jgi:glycosyltransferase involved in cell wall biosynthesis/GR25 family glycosyltransferase involved in LPS biosynthesis
MSDFASTLEAPRKGGCQAPAGLYSNLGSQLHPTASDHSVEGTRTLAEARGQRFNVGSFLAAGHVDAVFVLNLRSRPDRRLRVARELLRAGISKFEFADGVDGHRDPASSAALKGYRVRPPGLKPSSAHVSEATQRILKKSSTPGTFGYLFSQQRIFENAIRRNLKRICVFDDDVIFTDDHEPILEGARQLLDTDWAIIHLGASEYSARHPADDGRKASFYSAAPHGTCGSFAVLYDECVFREILEAIAELDGPFDNCALGSVYRRRLGQCHVIYPNACGADVHSSSIRNPRDQFEHAAKMRWPLTVERYRAFRAPHVINVIVREPALLPEIPQVPGNGGADLIVNGFCLTDDGPRPLHPGRSAVDLANVAECRSRFDDAAADPDFYGCLEGSALPRSDLTVLWPPSVAPTRDSMLWCLLSECYGVEPPTGTSRPVRVVPRDRLAIGRAGMASVVIPVAHTYCGVKKAVESAIRQNFDSVEIILVIDHPMEPIDGDTLDRDLSELAALHGHGHRRDVRLIRHSRVRHAGGALNTGLLACRGEFVAFVDAVGVADDRWLSATIGHLRRPGNDGIDACGWSLVDRGSSDKATLLREPGATDVVPLQASGSGVVVAAAVTFRRDPLLATLGFAEERVLRRPVPSNGRLLRLYADWIETQADLQAPLPPRPADAAISTAIARLLCIRKDLTDPTRMEQVTHPTNSPRSPSLTLANQLARSGAHEQAIELYKRLRVERPELREMVDFNLKFYASRMSGRPSDPARTCADSTAALASWHRIEELGSFPKPPWVQEFGPGTVGQCSEDAVALSCEDGRIYFSHRLCLEAGYRYMLRFRVRGVTGNAGDVAAVLAPEHRLTLATASCGSWGNDGQCELQFGSAESVTASLRVGIGTTAPVRGACRLEIEGIEIRRRAAVRHSNPDLSAFACQHIDPALHLPPLRGLCNDYSPIAERARALRESANWTTLAVSIIVTGCGQQALLRNTLASLCRQDYPKAMIQVIVVDDGGRDDAYEQVFFEYDKQLEIYLCRQTRDGDGTSRARNLGARLAKGQVLLFLDNGTLLPESFVSSLMSFHHVSDRVSVLGVRARGAAKWVGSPPLPTGAPQPEPGQRVADGRQAEFEASGWLKQSRSPFLHVDGGSSSVSRSRFFEVGGYDECFRERGYGAQEFAYRLWSQGQYFVPMQDVLEHYQDDEAALQDRLTQAVEGQRSQRMLVARCPHPSVRGFGTGGATALVPQFSIYIPAFNVSRYIRDCVDSALAQTHADLEVVIVDDGSTDGTSDLLQSYRGNPRVRIIRQSNGGIGSASNRALRACRGEYVVQLDSDDLLRPHALEAVAAHLARHPEIECLYTRYTLIDDKGRIVGPGWSPQRFDRYENLVGMSVPHMRVFRRALYHRTTGFDDGIVNAVDYDFYLKLSDVAQIHFLDADLYLYRVHGTQTSSAQAGAQVRNHRIVVERHLARLGLTGFEVSNPNPFEPRRNCIALPGTDFALELSRRSFPQPAIEGGLTLPEPRSVGNDYSAMQEHVRACYARADAPPYTERVSIVVPVYNRAERLGRCLAGIFHQSYPRDLIEVVIVDDGSSDEVMTVVRKYSEWLDIQYVKQADRGYRLSAARNAGIHAARHRNISIIDCDLIPLRAFIESFMQYLHHFDNLVLLGHQRFVDPTGISDDDILADPEVLGSMRQIRSENSTMREGDDGVTVDWRYALYEETDHLKNDQFPYRAFSSGHVAYRKALIERAGLYDEDFVVWGCEDNEAGYRLFQTGAFFVPVLEAVDLHQEPPTGKNETDRESHRKISRQLLQDKVPATRGWFGKGYERKPGVPALVTIGVPVHNTGRFAVDAIRSALAQDMPDIEVLVYDDASTDGTLGLIRAAFRGDPRVHVIEGREHRNVTYARNEIIRHARSEFIGFLDSDDLLEVSCVRECVAAFRADAAVGLVCTGYSRIAEDGAAMGAGWTPSRFNREGLMHGNIFTHFRMFRVRDWNRCRQWDAAALRELGYGEDWDLCLMLAEVSRFTRISKPLYRYRMRSTGITQSSRHEYKASQTRWVVRRWLDRLGRHDLEVISTSETNPSAIGFVRR